ncbi:hypothetical protein ACA910_007808 [Epithemia clementina (nom. ined.)]
MPDDTAKSKDEEQQQQKEQEQKQQKEQQAVERPRKKAKAGTAAAAAAAVVDTVDRTSLSLSTADNNCIVVVQSHILEKEATWRQDYARGQPFCHGVLENVLTNEFMDQVLMQVKQHSKVNFKESDLFRVYQSMDLANLSSSFLTVSDEHKQKDDNDDSTVWSSLLLQLRQVLYSQEWRNFMERLCGLPTNTLTEQVDGALNCHTTGCHLLCHDDVIGTRKISYILYLTDPDWTAEEGGALELYDRCNDPDMTNASASLATAVPQSIPSCTILPTFNTMAFFEVKPGVSFHAVQEVLGDRPRLSLQGWYHAATAPDHSEAATLSQLKTKAAQSTATTTNEAEDDATASSYTPLVYPLSGQNNKDEDEEERMDQEYLSQYLHETYLTANALEDIRQKFEEDSSVQLRNFLNADWIDKIDTARQRQEQASSRSVLDTDYYRQGTSHEWKLVGPAHKQRFLEYQPSSSASTTTSTLDDDNHNTSSSAGTLLQHLREHLLCSLPFQRFLAKITSLGLPLGYKGTIRRFRKGLDYTVAHYGILTQKSVLDATLCFVAGTGVHNQATGGDQEEEEEGNDTNPQDGKPEENDDDISPDDLIWQSGDCGGFECYIAADGDDDGDNSKAKQAADEYNQDDDTELLSVSASNNTLSLVYRDPGTMRFVKYVGAGAPSSRWDIAMEYQVAEQSEEDEAEESNDADHAGDIP